VLECFSTGNKTCFIGNGGYRKETLKASTISGLVSLDESVLARTMKQALALPLFTLNLNRGERKS